MWWRWLLRKYHYTMSCAISLPYVFCFRFSCQWPQPSFLFNFSFFQFDRSIATFWYLIGLWSFSHFTFTSCMIVESIFMIRSLRSVVKTREKVWDYKEHHSYQFFSGQLGYSSLTIPFLSVLSTQFVFYLLN